MLAVAGVAGGLYQGWASLAAAGLAPLILGLAPCAAMCALGLCANRKGQANACSSAENDAVSRATDESVAEIAATGDPPSRESAQEH